MNQKVIYIKNIKHNLKHYGSFNKKLTIMVKANAYGHGYKEIAKILENEDVKLGVANLDEAMALRECWNKEILIVEPINCIKDAKKHNFQFVVEDIEFFNDVVANGLAGKCYIKVNTGMNRFGVKYDDAKMIKRFASLMKKHHVKGLMTHFSHFDDQSFTKLQYQRFQNVRKHFPNDISISFGGSGTSECNFEFDELRVGIGFYGYGHDILLPIMSVKSQVLKVLSLEPGEGLGYGNSYVADEKKKIAVVGVGYGDGLRRDLSGFYVKINNKKCAIVGNVCMDCLFADVSHIVCHDADEVVFADAEKVASFLNTIPYEVLTGYSSLRCRTVIY